MKNKTESALDPHHLYTLGVNAYKLRQYNIAEKFISTALDGKPDQEHIYHRILGDIFRDQGNLEKAELCYKNAISIYPDYVEVLHNLGTIYFITGRVDDAATYYQHVLASKPDYILALYGIGLIRESQGNFREAKNYFSNVVEKNPIHEDASLHLATSLQNLGQWNEAVDSYMRAISIKPRASTHVSLGILLQKLGKSDLALEHYSSALSLDPENLEALNNTGSIYSHAGMFEKAKEFYERVLALRPDYPESLNNLGNIHRHFAEIDKAIAYYKRAVKASPDYREAYQNLLLSMAYSSFVSPSELYERSVEFGQRIANPLMTKRDFIRDTNPERKLKIGYVSPDFRDHAVNYFFEPLLNHHDRKNFEIFCYSNVMKEDSITEKLKAKVDHWRDIKDKSDNEAVGLIEQDKIDILIDLAGHTGSNRLLLFARKPAPIQATWLGYPATTGMKAMDYRITDPYAEPEGMTEHLNVEKLWQLPQIFCCYGAHENSPAVIDHPPSEDNGYITFGCFNNFAKVTDTVLETWKGVMDQVPDSRLLLEIAWADTPAFRAELDARLKRLDMPLDRITIEPRKKENQFILYNKIDIALDPFPCVGGTTSMDTVWMGVPFITLAGNHFASRMGVTILTNIGLPNLIAKDTEDYIAKAVALANDHNRLREIRNNLRDKAATSPMMDQAAFARNMEDAYRQMWKMWCLDR